MPGKKRMRMRGVKHTSKKLEEEILECSRTLANNPGILRPQCAGNCRKCAFDKTFKIIDSMQKIRNDPDALIKEASKMMGDDIAKAYAGTISLAAAGSVPLLASTRLGDGTVSYAVRGTVGADKQIGCQHYTDPKIRLLLYNQFVKKNDLYMYSFEDTLVCSDEPNMPEDYLYDTFWETPYDFPDDEITCTHDASAVLEIEIKSLKETVKICENCAKPVSSLQCIMSRMIGNNLLEDFEVRVRHKYHSEGENDCEVITGDKLKEYMFGKVTDSMLIGEVKRSKLGDLKDSGSATYIIGTDNYGSSLESFTDALTGEEEVIKALRKFLSKNSRPLVLKSNRVNEALQILWNADWKAIVAEYTDASTAEKMGDQSKNQPTTVLENAHNIYISADVVDSLPTFNRPGTITTIADKLAKAAKVGGSDMIIKMVPTVGIKDNKSRSIAAAFVMALGSDEIPIKLSKEEKEYADYLVPFAKAVVTSDGEKYRDAMNTLLTATGSGERV